MKVSVIIPSFNRVALLSRALNSVLTQSDAPDEVIVIDDGSTDRSRLLVERDYPQVRYVRQVHTGVSAARNHGIRLARNNWVAFLDSDDEWHADKLALQCEALKQQPDYRVCHTDEIWIRNGRRVNPMHKHSKQGGWIFQQCLPLCAMSPSSILIHKEVFAAVGYFDEALPACEDYDLWLRITAKYPVLYLSEKLLNKYGGHADQLSKQHWGMDRFRVIALEKIINSGGLDPENERAALDMLNRKIEILLNGAKKHNNREILNCYPMKQSHYRRRLELFMNTES